jgi:hypothetical protein
MMKTHILKIACIIHLCATCAAYCQIKTNESTATNTTVNTNSTSHTKLMNYTLVNLQNNKKISNPTDADIRATIASLKDDFGPVLELNTPGVEQPLQMDMIDKALFGFTCRDGDQVYITKNGHEYSTEVAIKIIISYRDQTPDWKKLGEWIQVPAQP